MIPPLECGVVGGKCVEHKITTRCNSQLEKKKFRDQNEGNTFYDTPVYNAL